MKRVAIIALVVPVLAAGSRRVEAKIESLTTAKEDDAKVAPFDPSKCDADQSAAPAPSPAIGPVPETWAGFDVEGELRDPAQTVRALFEPTMSRFRATTEDARTEIRRVAAGFGYHVVGLGTRETAAGPHAVVHLAAMPMVRRIQIDLGQTWWHIWESPLDDEVRRHMGLRVGAYLPWSPQDRGCLLLKQRDDITKYLRDEGYFDAQVTVSQTGDVGADINVSVSLGAPYEVDIAKIQVPDANGLPVSKDEILDVFRHRGTCLLFNRLCYLPPHFTRAQLEQDRQRVADLFKAKGYPAVRVTLDFDPAYSLERRTTSVRFVIRIDLRRRVDVAWEGYSGVSIDSLSKKLTFNEAQSADEVEINNSARAVTEYLQQEGFFDARVTFERVLPLTDRRGFSIVDKVIFRVDLGKNRTVRTVTFAGNDPRHVPVEELENVLATKPARLSTRFLGGNTAVTAAQLAADEERIRLLYRNRGYRDVSVHASVATEPSGLDSAAASAALLMAGKGGDDLHVRFTIDEGAQTQLTEIHVELADHGDAITAADASLCHEVLKDLAAIFDHPAIAQQPQGHCAVKLDKPPAFKDADALESGDRLRDRLFSQGRPRAEVEYSAAAVGPYTMSARYKIVHPQPLVLGKVVIRGNFRTADTVILGQLGLREGDSLTKDALAEAARNLRNTGLFDAVNISMPDLANASAGAVNAVVEVTERYDFFAQVDVEVGSSSYNGTFSKLIVGFKNLFGRGISLDLSGTIGLDLFQYIGSQELTLRQLGFDATLRIPQWLWLPWQTEATVFHDRRDTPRFGLVSTTGVTVGGSYTWQRTRTASQPARALTLGGHVDFRSRERNIDVLRPIGADADDSQVPVNTTTGSVGATFEWEQRVDRRGTLSPLAPEGGFRLEGQISYATPVLLSQDTFIKISAAASKFYLVGDSLILRGDLRYDHGIPLGAAALLPEVERFFAGGDSTVRGYADDRLATEIVQVGVPPLGNLQQIRVLPSGGNIRALASVDAQVRVYKVLATAVFMDAGLITNQWSTASVDDIRPSVGVALVRVVTPFGAFAWERAMPLRPRLGDDPTGRWHISFAARAQF